MTEPAPSELWKRWLRTRAGKDGQPEFDGTLLNAALVLANDRAFAGCWAWDSFAQRLVCRRRLPDVTGVPTPDPGEFSDRLVNHTRMALDAIARLSVQRETVEAAIASAAAAHTHNPLTDWLDSLRWDGESRLDHWLTRYLGVHASDYTRAVGRWWLISAVARAYKPGCQADHVLVLEGATGAGKSSAIRILGGQYTLPKLPSLREYDRAAHSLAGRWIGEIGELDALRGAASSQIKDFITLRVDHYHEPYGRAHVSRLRTIVFAATTNETGYLDDPTGARRFWPVTCGSAIDTDKLAQDRGVLWAEAVAAYAAGGDLEGNARPHATRWWPDARDTDTAEALESEQEARQVGADAWLHPLSAWVARTLVEGVGVTTGQALEALGVDAGRWDRLAQSRAGACLRRLGLEARKVREHGSQVRRYYRP